ncbi:hypothetical protein MM5_171 [Morganella phage vB_Mm5]
MIYSVVVENQLRYFTWPDDYNSPKSLITLSDGRVYASETASIDVQPHPDRGYVVPRYSVLVYDFRALREPFTENLEMSGVTEHDIDFSKVRFH